MAKKSVRKGRGKGKSKADCCSYKSKNIVLPLLSTLADLKSNHRTFVLAHLDERTLRTLCEAINKVLHAKLPSLVKSNLKRGLLANKDCLRRLCHHNKLTPSTVRRNLLRMGGGQLRLVFRNAIPLYSRQ